MTVLMSSWNALSSRERAWLRLAVFLWAVLLIGAFSRALVRPSESNIGIYRVYAEAGRTWLAGAPLYAVGDGWDVFPYSPLIAVLLSPLSILPDDLGSVAWRLTLAFAYLTALGWWAWAALPRPLSPIQRTLLFLLVIPVTGTTMVNGQIGGLVIASILLGLTAAATERWNWCAVFIAFACLIKAYPVAVALLLVVTYPRQMVPRLLLAGLALLAVPFLFQSPGYVLDQYAGWLALMRGSDRHEWPLHIANRNVSLLFRVWWEPLSRGQFLTLQLLTAAGTAVLCVAARRAGWARRQVLLTVLGLAVSWMTLFGPVVESFTYILVGPTLAWMLLEAWMEGRAWAYRAVLVASLVVFLGATVSVWFTHSIHVHSMGPHALAGLCLLACVLVDLGQRFSEGVAVVEQRPNASELARAVAGIGRSRGEVRERLTHRG